MNRWLLGLACVAISATAIAQQALAPPQQTPPQQEGKVVQEVWQSALIDGKQAGYVQFTVREIAGPKVTFLRASRKLSLTLKRFGDVAKIEAVTGTDETREGVVLGTFMQQGLGKGGINLVVKGVVEGQELHVAAQGAMQFDKRIPWNTQVVGALGELEQIKTKQPKPGDEFDYLIYEPIINSIVKVHAKAEGVEPVQIGNQKPNLLKVISTPTEVQGLTLPGSIFWFDAKYELVRSDTIMPGLGRLVLERTSQAEALKPCVGPDLGWKQSITLDKALMRPHDAAQVVYRIRAKDANLATLFAQDERQSARVGPDGNLELSIRPVRKPPESDPAGIKPPDQEFLLPNNFLNSDDALVRQHAAAAVGAETDPWQKALRIERWVHGNMKAMDFTEAMAPAARVAQTLSGDCTEYSMLMAAMCRASGVPSRIALGMVYVNPQGGRPPMFAMHMWTEVWVHGKWIGLDSTLGRGPVGAAHIKVSDHSWHQVATMTPLMPLMRVMMSQPEIRIEQEQATLTVRP